MSTITQATETPAVTWAGGICSAVSTWQTQLTNISNGLKGSDVTKADITKAVDSATSATQDLVDTLQGLDRPQTQAGQKAQAEVDSLGSTLSADADKIKSAAHGATDVSSALGAVSVATGALVDMGNAVSSTVDNLKQLDTNGELQKAFDTADSCNALGTS
jgi:cellobiose phosphorylase